MMTKSVLSLLQPLLLWLLCSSNLSGAVSDHNDLVSWLRTKPNAFFSEKIVWKELLPGTPSSFHAMHAAEDIEIGETLIVVPQSALVTSKGTGFNCDAVKMLLEELEKGEGSEYFPYIDYMFGDDSKKGNLPFTWSDVGKEVLDTIIGDSLYPRQFDHHLVQRFCPNVVQNMPNPTQLEIDAYLFMIARSWDDVMIPVYDMMNHRNGHWRNVEATSAHLGEDIRVFARREIKAGEQLYISYNECDDDDCKGLKYTYVTPSILSDYGFVEQYPRRFKLDIDDEGLVAEVDQDEKTGETFLTWPLGRRPNMEQLNYISAQLKRLNALESYVERGISMLDSNHERGVIEDYYSAYKEVLELAIAYHKDDGTAGSVATKEFDPLTEPKGPGVEGMNIEVCWSNPSDRDWDTSDSSESQYQEIEFTYNKERDNTCLHLSGWLQTCTNFRPHYHEAFVHVPAQYVDDVKRVAFLGGGDNMILHEILKYPNLELVVGMELDQQVIRSAYKNLGTLPYFDDHRVHWWFGDATKSLFALPESYFGTFDLVLVDLQTFVADALKVTDKLTIMDSAILLMKPDGGVIAKNEDFNVRTNVGFAKYTVDLEYHDLPQICQQSITMGSNSIDFLTAKPKAHGVEVFAIDLPDSNNSDPFYAWYNYRQTVHDTCEANFKEESSTNDSEAKGQLGIIVILEAENVSHTLGFADVRESIRSAVTKLGLTEVSISSDSDKNVFFFIMKEGYITARVLAEKKYISFDVLLWDNLELIDELNSALVNAFGGNLEENTTSFRFVSGGMSGLQNNQKDILTKVAAETETLLCESTDFGEPVSVETSDYDNTMRTILSDLVTVLMEQLNNTGKSIIGVMCGKEGIACASLEALQKLDSVPLEIIPIFSCNSFDDMNACQTSTESAMRDVVKKYKKLDALVMDNSLPYPMGQILEGLFSNLVTHNKIMERAHVVVTPTIDGEPWRNVLVDRFRTDIVLFDGANRADLKFSKLESGTKGSYFKWRIFSAFDSKFYHTLTTILSTVRQHTGLEAEVEEVANGIVNYVADFAVHKEFTDSDYDKTRSKAQWNSQTPTGHQTIFTFNIQAPKTQLDIGEEVLAEHEPGPWDVVYGGAVVQEYLGDETYFVLYDDEDEPEKISREQIRKFSDSDKDLSTSFEIGDLIFYRNEDFLWQNGVVSRVDEDGTYAIYLLNTSGTKLYGVRRDELMFQYETANFYKEIPDLSISILKDAFESVLDTDVAGAFPIGSGVIMTAFWDEGHAVLKWDGMKRVDINYFTYEEDMEERILFQEAFCDKIEYMKSVSRDEHPRGYGSVVNFASEIENPPHWVQN